VFLNEVNNDNYFAWLIGKGWYEMSLTMQLIFMQAEQKERTQKYIALAKEQYPEAFK
jgi:hypothetical protein